MFGKWVGDTRQGWVLWAVSAILFVIGLAVVIPAEQTGNPILTSVGANQVVGATQSGGNMEGKEVRYGITISSLQEVTTTATSTGTVMSFHDSYTPLGGLVLIANIALGEIIFGGVGSGLYGMMMFAIIAVFIAGLMVGSTPEYLGKKIERKEIMMAVLALLVSPLLRFWAFPLWPWCSPRAWQGSDACNPGRMASRRSCTPTPPPTATTARPSPD